MEQVICARSVGSKGSVAFGTVVVIDTVVIVDTVVVDDTVAVIDTVFINDTVAAVIGSARLVIDPVVVIVISVVFKATAAAKQKNDWIDATQLNIYHGFDGAGQIETMLI